MLVLASASPRRQELLRNAAISFVVQPANINETPLAAELPRECAERLAREKAFAVFQSRPRDWVLGADTIVGSAITNLNAGGSAFPVTLPTLDNRYQVNLPAANINGSIGVALLSGSTLVDLELSAAQNEGKSETISSPRSTTPPTRLITSSCRLREISG